LLLLLQVFGQRRKQLVKDIHAQLSQMLMLALKHVPGGYMCRMQVGGTVLKVFTVHCVVPWREVPWREWGVNHAA
jgi:hypothetical protein